MTLLLIYSTYSWAAVDVLRITPSGEQVDYSRQINITFNKEMAPLGAAAPQNLPISIVPKVDCQWRWVDSRNLSCDLNYNASFAKSTEYVIAVSDSLKSHTGEELRKKYTHTFKTERPQLRRVYLQKLDKWIGPLRPILELQFNQPVSKEAIKEKLTIEQQKKINYQFVDIEEYSKSQGEYRSFWYVEVLNDIQRSSAFVVQLKKGLRGAEGPLGSEQDFNAILNSPEIFKIESFECYQEDEKGQLQIVSYKENELRKPIDASNGMKRCAPQLPKRVNLSNPVIPSMNYPKMIMMPNPDKKGLGPFSGLYDFYDTYPSKTLQFPENLDSKISYYFDLSEVQNVFGEKIKGVSVFEVLFSQRDPKVVTRHDEAVIEKGIGNDQVAIVTKMQSFDFNYQTWSMNGIKKGNKTIKSKVDNDVPYFQPLGVEQVLEGLSGTVIHSIPQEKSYRTQKVTQVSPYQVLGKLGHYNSLVWVLDLQTGRPVQGAQVDLVSWAAKKVYLKAVLTNELGLAVLPGIESLGPDGNIFDYTDHFKSHHFIRVRKDQEMALLPLSYRYELYSDFGSYGELKKKGEHLVAWGLTPQGIYRSGDKVEFKIYVRNEGPDHLELPPPDLKFHLKIIDPSGKIIYEQNKLSLNEFGSMHGDFIANENSLSGVYQFELVAKWGKKKTYTMNPMNVTIADFTPSPFKVSCQVDKEVIHHNQEFKITTMAQMHSGGLFTGNESKVTIQLIPLPFVPQNSKYQSYSFFASDSVPQKEEIIHQNIDKLDREGKKIDKLKINSKISYGKLSIESSVQDDKGKNVSSKIGVSYYGQDYFLGGKLDKWFYQVGSRPKISLIVLGKDQKVVKGKKISTQILKKELIVSKVKDAALTYRSLTEEKWVEVQACENISQNGPVDCEFLADQSGYYKIQSKASDNDGDLTSWSDGFYVVGKGDYELSSYNDDHLELMTEKKDVSVDQNVTVLIKNPLGKKVQGLVTIERYGILDSWAIEIQSATHQFDFKIKKEYLPGFYFNVTLFSPRVAPAKDITKLDLGKPASRMGQLMYKVTDPTHALKLSLKTNKNVYYPKETVRLDIATPKKEGKTEVAIAVLDEAVFDLLSQGQQYFDIYGGLTLLNPLDVKSFSLLKMLIGSQLVEKKGANQGGDGGQMRRDAFDNLAYWNPSFVLDGGKGSVEFQLPDDLTKWRVLVVATDQQDRLGNGQTHFVTKLPTEIRAAMPESVVEGDQFSARFTIMNREHKKRKIDVEILVTGPIDNKNGTLKKMTLEIPPMERSVIDFPLKVGKIDALKSFEKINFQVKAGDSTHSDHTVVEVKVRSGRTMVHKVEHSVLLNDKSAHVDLYFPEMILAQGAGVEVLGSSTLMSHLFQGFKFFKEYDYECWEQKLSRALAAAQYIKLQGFIEQSIEWNQAKSVIEKTLKEASLFQLESGAMSYYGSTPSAFLSAYTAQGFAWLKSYGYSINPQVEKKLLSYLKLLLRKNRFDFFYDDQMKATIRAMALYGIKKLDQLAAKDIYRLKGQLPHMNIFGKLYFYMASLGTKHSKDALDGILAHLVIDPKSISINEINEEKWNHFHSTQRRTLCTALYTFVEGVKNKKHLKKTQDLPVKLARSVINDLKANGHFWSSTQESIYCLNALIGYVDLYEKGQPDIKMKVFIDAKEVGKRQFKDRLVASPIVWNLDINKKGAIIPLEILKEGSGPLYVVTQMSYSPSEQKTNHRFGMEIKKVISVQVDGQWKKWTKEMKLKRGQVLLIDLMVNVPSPRYHVVLDDPLPGALASLNTLLATTEVGVEESDEQKQSRINKNFLIQYYKSYREGLETFNQKDLRNDKSVFYAQYLSQGNHVVSYLAQVVSTGQFTMLPSKAMEMYNPEIYSMTPEQQIVVKE